MKHDNFFIFKAKNNHELGVLMGKRFSLHVRSIVEKESKKSDWSTRVLQAQKYLKINQKYFPNFIDELKGYSEGSGIDFIYLWALHLEDETNQTINQNRCTTIITNDGLLIAHNEDWEKTSANTICFLFKEIGKTKIFELHYYHTLGGDAIGINSNGFVSAINSLSHPDIRVGVSRNIIARWLSETKNPEKDFQKLKNIPRASGYNHNVVSLDGKIWNLECTAKKDILTHPTSPFVHTNHYLSELKIFDTNSNSTATIERYNSAQRLNKSHMTINKLIDVTNDTSSGDVDSIMNERTVAKMVIDMKNMAVKGWLRAEKEKGWVDYNLKDLFY